MFVGGMDNEVKCDICASLLILPCWLLAKHTKHFFGVSVLGEIYKYKRCGISKTLEHKSRPRCKEEVFLQRNLKNLRMAVCKFFPLFFEHTITTLLFVTTHIKGLNRNSFHKMKHTHDTTQSIWRGGDVERLAMFL